MVGVLAQPDSEAETIRLLVNCESTPGSVRESDRASEGGNPEVLRVQSSAHPGAAHPADPIRKQRRCHTQTGRALRRGSSTEPVTVFIL